MALEIKPIALATIARLKHFFLAHDELQFESASSPEVLKARLCSASCSRFSLTAGAQVRIWGDEVHIGWSQGLFYRNAGTKFHGIIESTPSGSRIRGRISAGDIVRAFMAFWFGAVALFSLLFIWTVFIPAGGMALIWFGSHLLDDSETETQLTGWLASVCSDADTLPLDE